MTAAFWRALRWLFGIPEPLWVCEWCSRGLHAQHDRLSGRCINADLGCECVR
jgi:hypothetical protein